MNPKVRVGSIVLYALTNQDAETINAQCTGDGGPVGSMHAGAATLEPLACIGSPAAAGNVLPMIVTRAAEDASEINGQVLLDANFTHWARNIPPGSSPGTYQALDTAAPQQMAA